MIALLLATILVQASPSPAASFAPATTLSPGWTRAAARDATAYAHYTRLEPDGSTSDLTANRQVCDCQPDTLARMLISALTIRAPHMTFKGTNITACGHTAKEMIATGIASKSEPLASNIAIIAFRIEPALYTLQYGFKSANPPSNLLNDLEALCPASTLKTTGSPP